MFGRQTLFILLLGLASPLGAQQTVDEPEPLPSGPHHTEEARMAYERAMQDYIANWSDRLQEYAERVLNRQPDAGGAPNQALTQAWARVQDDWRRLQEAPSDQWTQVQGELDESIDHLRLAWRAATKEPPSRG